MESNSKSDVYSEILLWTLRCAAHPQSLVGNICMDGAYGDNRNYKRQPSDTVKENTEEDTEKDTEEDTEDDIIPELINFFRLEIVELITELHCQREHYPRTYKEPNKPRNIMVRLRSGKQTFCEDYDLNYCRNFWYIFIFFPHRPFFCSH